MIVADLLRWWYLHGWTWCIKQVFLVNSKKILNFFSVLDLAKTLFSPFRQDSLQTKGAPLSVKLQALGGNIISRFFGFIIRSTLIVVGSVTAVLNLFFASIVLLLWPLVPVIPIASVVLFMAGFKI